MQDKKSFLKIVEVGLTSSGKTKIFNVRTQDDRHLGSILWHAPWRRYCFYPVENTLFDYGCMNQIAEFIEQQMAERRT
jgi:hypothetical protein